MNVKRDLPQHWTLESLLELSRKVDAGTIELDVRTDPSAESGMIFSVTEIGSEEPTNETP